MGRKYEKDIEKELKYLRMAWYDTFSRFPFMKLYGMYISGYLKDYKSISKMRKDDFEMEWWDIIKFRFGVVPLKGSFKIISRYGAKFTYYPKKDRLQITKLSDNNFLNQKVRKNEWHSNGLRFLLEYWGKERALDEKSPRCKPKASLC